jgi:exonuclease III
MKIILWNIQGINDKRKHRLLQNMLCIESLDILMLQEIKNCGENVISITQEVWRNDQSLTLDSKGATRGLSILWNLDTIILENLFSMERSVLAQFRLTCL